jgi:methylglutaconyl-CoA hydratase
MNDAQDQLATVTFSGRVATLTINRPDARNAMSIDLLAALHARADELARREDVSVLVLTGAGKAFCAGMDLKAVLGGEGSQRSIRQGMDSSGREGSGESDGGDAWRGSLAHQLLSSLADFCVKLRSLPMVVVGRINGAAIGGGCGLACVCDVAVTHADSKMGFPEVDLGVCPAVVAPWLVRRIGAGKARQILLSGGLMSGQRAFELGIVSHVVATSGELDGAVAEIAGRLATGGPNALRATKQLLNHLDGSLDADLSRRGAELSARVLATPEAREMLRAKIGG